MKYLFSILCLLCIQFFAYSAFSQVDIDSLCLRLTQFEEIRKNKLRYTSDNDHICSNFIINEIPADSNCVIRLYKFENAMYEGSSPGFILIEKDQIEIYDLFTFSHLIKRIISSDVHPETLKTWIVIILERYDMLLCEMSASNIVMKFSKGNYTFYVTLKSIKKK